jgi:hypothetical protein
MARTFSPKITAILVGSVGVIAIALGFVIASMLSCTEIQYGYGPPLYNCPDGIYAGPTNPHPYFDMLMPWILGGILLILWSAYHYKNEKAASTSR